MRSGPAPVSTKRIVECCACFYSDSDSYLVHKISEKASSPGGTSNSTPSSIVPVVSELKISTYSVARSCVISSSNSLLAYKAIVVFSIDTLPGGSGFVCYFFKNSSWLLGWRSIFCWGVRRGTLHTLFFFGVWFCRPATRLGEDCRWAFCTVVDLRVVSPCSCLGDQGPLYGMGGCQLHGWSFDILFRLVARASSIWPRAWAGTMGHFASLRHCDNLIRQYGASSAYSGDFRCWCYSSWGHASSMCVSNCDFLFNFAFQLCLSSTA